MVKFLFVKVEFERTDFFGDSGFFSIEFCIDFLILSVGGDFLILIVGGLIVIGFLSTDGTQELALAYSSFFCSGDRCFLILCIYIYDPFICTLIFKEGLAYGCFLNSSSLSVPIYNLFKFFSTCSVY
jgi:hypothetical protein